MKGFFGVILWVARLVDELDEFEVVVKENCLDAKKDGKMVENWAFW